MKRLLVDLGPYRIGKVFSEEKRVILKIPDVVWNNETVFEEVTLTYAYLSAKVGAFVPTIGTGKPTTDKFKAYQKLYAIALYLNNKEALDEDTFVFENRWVPQDNSQESGYTIISRSSGWEVRENHGSQGYGIVFKNQEDAILAVELLGTSLSDMLI
jgi:hypothetical protein